MKQHRRIGPELPGLPQHIAVKALRMPLKGDPVRFEPAPFHYLSQYLQDLFVDHGAGDSQRGQLLTCL